MTRLPFLVGRRELLQIGSLGMVGLGLPGLLRAETSSPPRRRSETSCIFIVQYGGASHHDTLDPKPNAAEEIRGPYKAIATSVPGLRITNMLPRLAQVANHFALVRSMTHDKTGHDGGMHICMTGTPAPRADTPYFGSLAAKLRPSRANVPSYVWLQNLAGDVVPWYLTGGVLGAACAPMVIGKDEDNLAKSDFRVRDFDPREGLTPERLAGQKNLLDQVAFSSGPMAQSARVRNFRQFQERALDLVTSPAARSAFDLHREPNSLRDRYGRHIFGQNCLMARRLIEAGVRLVTVNAWCGRASTKDVLATQGWDHHGADIQKCGIFDTGTFGLGHVLPRFDQGLAALLDDMNQRGLLESTLVVIVGEFGRTPKITKNPYPGRDHWPQCYTALLAGAGIRGGVIHGSSDKIGAFVHSHPVTPMDLGATLFHALGIPPETRYGPDGFSLRVSDGEPVTSLFG